MLWQESPSTGIEPAEFDLLGQRINPWATGAGILWQPNRVKENSYLYSHYKQHLFCIILLTYVMGVALKFLYVFFFIDDSHCLTPFMGYIS
jgi:hypothetical protein